MIKKVLFSVLAGAFASAVCAGSANYKVLDDDKDGLINPEEADAMPALVENWTEFDVNEDGKIDAVEFSRFESLRAMDEATEQMGKEFGGYSEKEKGYMREQ